MPQLKYWNGSAWVDAVIGAQGPTGDPGVTFSTDAPASTNVLWVDTDENLTTVLPTGGTTGQLLAKSSNTNYDVSWTSNIASPTLTGTVVVSGDINLSATNAVGSINDEFALIIMGAV